ncbi:MAG: hypothetical protein JNL57_05380 [Bacteroidetes bacterium]|nr:hypothetical protein [Bacteroidota bacterium]
MMNKFLCIVTVLLFAGTHDSKASHLMGADMQYTSLGNGKYKITAKLYRDCRGIALNNPAFGAFAGTGGGSGCGSYSLGIGLRSIRDITPICKTASKPCSPPNTGATGTGVEEHVFDTIVDFNTAPLNLFTGKSSCGEVTFYIGQCCRNGAITTGAAGNDFFATCTINFNNLGAISGSATNSSPEYSNSPIIFTCCNQPYRYNHGSKDLAERDSLSYRLVPGLSTASGVSVNYSSPFSYKYPLTSYCATPGVINCTPNPNAKPPRGFFLDTGNGDLVFTPVNCSEVAIIAVEVTEHRKTPGGNWVWIGKSRRDIQIVIRDDCGPNNPPEIAGPSVISVCPGDSGCVTYTITDAQALPNQTKADTVTAIWNQGVPGATFRIKDTTAREKEAVFCWKVPQDAAGKTFSFTIMAEDQACPVKSQTIKGVQIKVCDKTSSLASKAQTRLHLYPQPCHTGDFLHGLESGRAWLLLDFNGRVCGEGSNPATLKAPDKPGIYLLRSGNSATLIQVLP